MSPIMKLKGRENKCLKIRLDKEKDKELLKKWGNIKNRTDKLNKQQLDDGFKDLKNQFDSLDLNSK